MTANMSPFKLQATERRRERTIAQSAKDPT